VGYTVDDKHHTHAYCIFYDWRNEKINAAKLIILVFLVTLIVLDTLDFVIFVSIFFLSASQRKSVGKAKVIVIAM
jgi:hypothetical protein